MRYFLYLILVLIVIIILVTVFDWAKDYLISRIRIGDKREDFIDYFVEKNISGSLAINVYESFQDLMNVKDFPVRRQDNIGDIYGIYDEDLDDLIVEIAEANDFEIPSNTDYWQEPIATVEDLIKFVASFPRKSYS